MVLLTVFIIFCSICYTGTWNNTSEILSNTYIKQDHYPRDSDNETLRKIVREIVTNPDFTNYVFSESIFRKSINHINPSKDYRIIALQKAIKKGQWIILGFNQKEVPIIVSVSHNSVSVLRRKELFIPFVEFQIDSLDDVLKYIQNRWNFSRLKTHRVGANKVSLIVCFEACFMFRIEGESDAVIQFSEESFFENCRYGMFLFDLQSDIRSKELQMPVIKITNRDSYD